MFQISNCQNATHIIPYCDECESTRIVYDQHHSLIFCRDCGMVLLEGMSTYFEDSLIEEPAYCSDNDILK